MLVFPVFCLTGIVISLSPPPVVVVVPETLTLLVVLLLFPTRLNPLGFIPAMLLFPLLLFVVVITLLLLLLLLLPVVALLILTLAVPFALRELFGGATPLSAFTVKEFAVGFSVGELKTFVIVIGLMVVGEPMAMSGLPTVILGDPT